MHSWALLRKSTPATRFFAAKTLHPRSLFSKPNNTEASSSSSSSSSSSLSVLVSRTSRNSNEEDFSAFQALLRSISSGVAIVGSSLGLCYWTQICNADSGSETGDVQEKKPLFLFNDTYRRRVFFKYEKRLRARSPPEKVFEYFASYKAPSGELYMTPADLMRAVVPVFPPTEADHVRVGYLKGERVQGQLHCAPSEFFMLFDTNNDGLVSFPEYIFFVTLLSIPESSFSVAFKMFDLDSNGRIDKQEFKKVMALMRAQNRHGTHHRGGMRLGLQVSGSVEDGGVVEYFFGKDGKGSLEHERFVKFLRDLHDEILRLEFAHYDYKSQGTISAKDFALSMVLSADMSQINMFLDQVDNLRNEPHLRDIRITFEEFKSFAELRKSLQPFSMAIFSYGKVNGLLQKQDLQRAAKQVCGISLTDNLLDMIYYIFDTNHDGSLSSDEFLRVLERRETDILQPREAGFVGLLSCWLNCTRNCSS